MTSRDTSDSKPLCQKSKCPCIARYVVEGRLYCGRCCPVSQRTDANRITESSPVTSAIVTETTGRVTLGDLSDKRLGVFHMCASARFKYNDVVWRSAEHAYQAMKFFYRTGKPELDDALFAHYATIVKAPSATEASRLGHDRRLPIAHDWNITNEGWKLKDRIMYDVILAKVEQNPLLAKLLLETGEQQLVYGTDEKHWGGDLNTLGRVHMMVRDVIRKKRATELA